MVAVFFAIVIIILLYKICRGTYDCCRSVCNRSNGYEPLFEQTDYSKVIDVLYDAGFSRLLPTHHDVHTAEDETVLFEAAVQYLIQLLGRWLDSEPGAYEERTFDRATENDVKLILTYCGQYTNATVFEYLLEKDYLSIKKIHRTTKVCAALKCCSYLQEQRHPYFRIPKRDRISTSELIEHIFECLQPETRTAILLDENHHVGHYELEWLRDLVMSSNEETLRLLLQYLPTFRKQTLLLKTHPTRDGIGESILFIALRSSSPETMITFISQQLTAEKWTKLLNLTVAPHAGTILHHVVSRKHYDILRTLLERDASLVLSKVVQTVDSHGYTFLHRGAHHIPVDIFHLVVSNLASMEDVLELFTLRTKTRAGASTILHLLTRCHRHDVIANILSQFISTRDEIILLNIKDNSMNSVIEFAKSKSCEGCRQLVTHWKALLMDLVINCNAIEGKIVTEDDPRMYM